MRKIRLSDNDAALFDEEMLPTDYDYLSRHKDVFRRMWIEQGKAFWSHFLQVFRSYMLRYSLLSDLPCDMGHLKNALDFAFSFIEVHYVNGKPNQAKNLLYQIAELGRNRHKFAFLDSRSVRKDPFYTIDTRDLFRQFFGPADEKSSYVKVYLLTPVYMRFGGSIVRCLTLWKEAPEHDPEDHSYFVPPIPVNTDPPPPRPDYGSYLCAAHVQDCHAKYYQEVVRGSGSAPVSLSFWGSQDPRFTHPENPLYNPRADNQMDWRQGLSLEDWQDFYGWGSLSEGLVKVDEQCKQCRERKKKKKKNRKKKKRAEPPAVEGDISTQQRDINIVHDQLAGAGQFPPIKTSLALQRPHEAGDAGSQPNSAALMAQAPPAQELVCEKRQVLSEPVPGRAPGQASQATQAPEQPQESVMLTNAELEQLASAFKTMKGKAGVKEDTDPISEQVELTVPVSGTGGGDLRATFYVEKKGNETTVTLAHLGWLDPSRLYMPGMVQGGMSLQAYSTIEGQYLAQLVPGFPGATCVCGEGQTHCTVEVNYMKQETGKKATHFFLTVANLANRNVIRHFMVQLLQYVVRRKKRPCAGWCMSKDDVLTLCQSLDRDIADLLGVTITIEDHTYIQTTTSKRKQAKYGPSTKKGSMTANFLTSSLTDMDLMSSLGTLAQITAKNSNVGVNVAAPPPPPPPLPLPMTAQKLMTLAHCDGESAVLIGPKGSLLETLERAARAKDERDAQARLQGIEPVRPTEPQPPIAIVQELINNGGVLNPGLHPTAAAPAPQNAQNSAQNGNSAGNGGSNVTGGSAQNGGENGNGAENTKSKKKKKKGKNKEAAEKSETPPVPSSQSAKLPAPVVTPAPFVHPPQVRAERSLDLDSLTAAGQPIADAVAKAVAASGMSYENGASVTIQTPNGPRLVTATPQALASFSKAFINQALPPPGYFLPASMQDNPPVDPVGDPEPNSDQTPPAGDTAQNVSPAAWEENSTYNDLAKLIQELHGDNKNSRLTRTTICPAPLPDPPGPYVAVPGSGEEGEEMGGVERTRSVCSGCEEKEPSLRRFKKCKKCKDEGILNARYYCSKDCQMQDWKRRHCREHTQKTLQ